MGLHPPKDGRRSNPWGRADGATVASGAFHRAGGAVIVDGAREGVGLEQPPPEELQAFRQPAPPAPPPPAAVPLGGVEGAAQAFRTQELPLYEQHAEVESWHLAEAAAGMGPGYGQQQVAEAREGGGPTLAAIEEEQARREQQGLPDPRSAECGDGLGDNGWQGAARVKLSAGADAYSATRGLRRTSRSDTTYVASPLHVPKAEEAGAPPELELKIRKMFRAIDQDVSGDLCAATSSSIFCSRLWLTDRRCAQ